jgi:hypothetical protein
MDKKVIVKCFRNNYAYGIHPGFLPELEQTTEEMTKDGFFPISTFVMQEVFVIVTYYKKPERP